MILRHNFYGGSAGLSYSYPLLTEIKYHVQNGTYMT